MADIQSTQRQYTPASRIITNDLMHQSALAKAPAIFAWLVEEAEAERFAPSAALEALASPVGVRQRTAASGETYDVPAYGPFQFVVTVARKVAAGEKFIEDIEYANVVKKGGLFAEWVFNSYRQLVRLQIEGVPEL